ncbi:hypothetical protein BXZ70DRAFT_956205 [Cristinia sonorae]|uniref:TPR-like protein n=1 Tax=Cristinia sonorae TaxID=1940300 RepID=A0A8K0UFU8_9AGAR|nr:hypothetical protein BXZ70DRAFT_956205 [Cristinia sonorae]
MTSQTRAAQLKAEGNTLFAQRQYKEARSKYSQAIDVDGNSAVLYSNRAACSQYLRKYLDAESDARKATELDATYAKAWARLAAATSSLGSDETSVHAWKKAIAALPENPNTAEKKQKEQYEAELKTMENRLQRPRATPTQAVQVHGNLGQTPWQRAAALENELAQRGEPSSAPVIVEAYEEWKKGLDIMNMQRIVSSPNGPARMGFYGSIEAYSNAIIRDSRVFHLSQNNWTSDYNNQVMLEAQMVNAWVEGGVQCITSEALTRQRQQGWDYVRPAITTTIRSYFIRGFMEATMQNRNDVGVEFIGQALELLRWGCETWRDVPQDDKGAVFHQSFVRGVHARYLDVYMKACGTDPGKYKLKTLLKEAEGLLRHCDIPAVSPSAGPGFFMSFTTYPKGVAHSMIGFYHARTAAQLLSQPSYDAGTILSHYKQAAEAYQASADCYPKDDENRVWFLNCALQNYFLAGTPLRITLPLMERIREELPDVLRIWEFSSLIQATRKTYQKTQSLEEKYRKGLKKKQFTMDSEPVPDHLKSQVPRRR